MKFTLLICLTLLFATCSDDDSANTCSVVNPVVQLDWLKVAIGSANKGPGDITVEQGTYQDQTVFTFTTCCPYCSMIWNGLSPVYRCDGTIVENVYASDPAITDRKVIWKTPPWKASCW